MTLQRHQDYLQKRLGATCLRIPVSRLGLTITTQFPGFEDVITFLIRQTLTWQALA
jgi:hypothetical protein